MKARMQIVTQLLQPGTPGLTQHFVTTAQEQSTILDVINPTVGVAILSTVNPLT
jgi:hypothetical protein